MNYIMSGLRPVWLCPCSPTNIKESIYKKYENEYRWAFNNKRKKSFNKMRRGDQCLFKESGQKYYTHFGIVKEKIEIDDDKEDPWKFRPPTAEKWKYTFTLEMYELKNPISWDVVKEYYYGPNTNGGPLQTQSYIKDNRRATDLLRYIKDQGGIKLL